MVVSVDIGYAFRIPILYIVYHTTSTSYQRERFRMSYFFGFLAMICLIGAVTLLLTND